MLQKSSMFQTAEVFFKYPTTELELIEISRKIKLAHTSVKKNLKELITLSIINQKILKKGKRNYPIYKANLESKDYKKYKKISNYAQILESGLIQFIEQKLAPKSIILFGSFSRGEDIEDSDIDLFIECKEHKLNFNKFETELNRNIQLHFKDSFSKYPKELKNNIANGIVLSGFLEVFK